MSLSQVYSRACVGVEAPLVCVEVHLGGGLPMMSIVGMPETAVREARDRVRAALVNSHFRVPDGRTTISLAPAELPKEGGGFDLPIALGILAATGQIKREQLARGEFLGELSLSGALRPVRGVLPAALRAAEAGRALVVPGGNRQDISLPGEGEFHCADTLLQVVSWLNGQTELEGPLAVKTKARTVEPDLADVIGQARARRALEVAAAGAHNLLLIGPPGTGKTMLASRLPGILPPMTEPEALETAALASVSRQGLDVERWKQRPFRSPHHTASAVALVGGGSIPRPGEVSLAHNGVLFLDELPEYARHVLEVLREPLESGRIIISRAARQAEFPARFQLVAAMNPCPCGHAGDPARPCRCSAEQIQRYLNRVSGPLLDRIDLQVEVPRPDVSILDEQPTGEEPSDRIRSRVAAARERQLKRAGVANAQLDVQGLREHCVLQSRERTLLTAAADRLALSPRACHRVLKVARTIADLDQSEPLREPHLAEALAYRSVGRAARCSPD